MLAKLAILAFVTSAYLVQGRPVKPVRISSCPENCSCRNIYCSQTKSRGRIKCEAIEVVCRGRNFILRLDEMPRNVTHLVITGDDMGHLNLDIFAKRFSRLRKLILPDNTIRSLRLTMKLRYLDTLVLDHNNLCYLPTRSLALYRSLKRFRARYNNLTFITDIRFPKSLIDLDLRDNHIETPRRGSFRGLHQLQFLRLTNNSISGIIPHAFRYLKSLESLLMDHNNLTQIPGYSFYYLPNVSFVGLTHNQIDSIDQYAFKQMGVKYHGLHEIRLEHNRIATLETSSISLLFSRHKIYAIYLYGNPLFCDCELYRTRMSTGRLFRDARRTQCLTPPELRGTTIQELDLEGCHEQFYDDFYDNYYDDYPNDDDE